jgi:hypothetical protein
MARPSWCFAVDDQVTHAGAFRRLHPFVGVEAHRVELCRDAPPVHGNRDLPDALDVLGVAAHGRSFPDARRQRIHAPVDEHPEARFAPPVEPILPRAHGFAPPLELRAILKGDRPLLKAAEEGRGDDSGAEPVHRRSLPALTWRLGRRAPPGNHGVRGLLFLT